MISCLQVNITNPLLFLHICFFRPPQIANCATQSLSSWASSIRICSYWKNNWLNWILRWKSIRAIGEYIYDIYIQYKKINIYIYEFKFLLPMKRIVFIFSLLWHKTRKCLIEIVKVYDFNYYIIYKWNFMCISISKQCAAACWWNA